MTGLFTVSMYIPALPEFITATEEKYPNQNSKTTKNYAGALFNQGLALGQILGPIYGATMVEMTNFRFTEDVLGLALIIFAICYFGFANGL